MTEWFYAQGAQRQGPVSAEEIAALFHRGELSVDTLVWTQSMTEWSPLGLFAAELGLERLHETETVHSVAPEPASPYAAPAAVASSYTAPVHAGEVVYAGFWKRLAAALIDSCVLTAAMLIVMFIGMLALGKMAIGIKVTRGTGEALTLGRSFGRWCAYFVLNLPCGIGTLISAFTCGLSERKQGLHDMMADTLVVDRWAFTAHPERQRRELGVVTWIVLGLLGLLVVGYALLMMFAVGMAAMSGAH